LHRKILTVVKKVNGHFDERDTNVKKVGKMPTFVKNIFLRHF